MNPGERVGGSVIGGLTPSQPSACDTLAIVWACVYAAAMGTEADDEALLASARMRAGQHLAGTAELPKGGEDDVSRARMREDVAVVAVWARMSVPF